MLFVSALSRKSKGRTFICYLIRFDPSEVEFTKQAPHGWDRAWMMMMMTNWFYLNFYFHLWPFVDVNVDIILMRILPFYLNHLQTHSTQVCFIPWWAGLWVPMNIHITGSCWHWKSNFSHSFVTSPACWHLIWLIYSHNWIILSGIPTVSSHSWFMI